MNTPILAIVGATATGKTRLALALAHRLGAEIVGADASQIYRGLDIGTGKIGLAERGDVRHHLIDVVEPDAPFDAAAFVRLADAALAEIRARGRHPLLCGGTGLYLRALIEGLCEAPPVPEPIRATLAQRIDAGELPAIHAELTAADPDAGRRIAPRDRQRVERALGVFLATGRSMTDWQRAAAAQPPRHVVRYAGLTLSRPALNTRIEARTRRMFADGLVDEVRALLERGHPPDLRSLQALGYAQAAAVVAGTLRLEAAVEQTIVLTRQYAKRQETWFRAVPGVVWLDAEAPLERNVESATALLAPGAPA